MAVGYVIAILVLVTAERILRPAIIFPTRSDSWSPQVSAYQREAEYVSHTIEASDGSSSG